MTDVAWYAGLRLVAPPTHIVRRWRKVAAPVPSASVCRPAWTRQQQCVVSSVVVSLALGAWTSVERQTGISALRFLIFTVSGH